MARCSSLSVFGWWSLPAAAGRPAATARGLGFLRLAFRRFALRAGPDHRQRHPPALVIDMVNPDGHAIAHGRHFVRAPDIPLGHLADVDQAAVLQTNVHEDAE